MYETPSLTNTNMITITKTALFVIFFLLMTVAVITCIFTSGNNEAALSLFYHTLTCAMVVGAVEFAMLIFM